MIIQRPMESLIGTTSRAAGLAVLALVLTGSCGASKAELRAAKTSGYDTDFALVYGETLAAVQKLYPNLVENAGAGVIKTAWHVVRFSEGVDDPNASIRTNDPNDPNNQQTNSVLAGRGNVVQTRYFIRFNVHVVGGKPWRVRVEGEASEWTAGEVPVPLKGADEPHWLKGRTDALEVAIYRRLEDYAVSLRTKPKAEPKPEKVDYARYGPVPEAAAKVVHAIVEAATTRDYAALRSHMAAELTWSAGAPPDADTALAMWQADGNVTAELVRVLEEGCRGENERITCPPDAAGAVGYVGSRAELALVGGAWKLVLFVPEE